MGLENILKSLRIISHDWNNIKLVISELKMVKECLRNQTILTKDLWDLYDEVSFSLMILEFEIDEVGFDGRIFSSVLTKFGFKDFTRDDYLAILNS
jgi:hypothetical protein